MNQNEKSKQLLEEYNDAMIGHAAKLLALEQEEEIEKLFDELAELPDPEYSDEFNANMQRLFNASKTTEHTLRVSKVFSFRKKILSIAACMVGVFVIGGSVLTISSDAFLEHLKYLVGKNFSTHTTFVVEKNTLERFKANMIENGWTNILYPAYLPSGYTLEDVECTKLKCRLIFSNENNKLTISIRKSGKNSSHILDTQDAVEETIYINGKPASYVIKDGDRNLIFLSSDNTVYIASTILDKLQIKDIAESLKEITF